MQNPDLTPIIHMNHKVMNKHKKHVENSDMHELLTQNTIVTNP